MKNIARINLLLIVGLMSFSSLVFSQETEILSQTIRGQVVDKETQVGIPGANIVVLGIIPLKGTSSDSQGNFMITGVPIGRQNIQVSFIGYEIYTISELLITVSKEVVLDIGLQEEAFALNEVEVTVDKRQSETINSMAMISARTFSAEDTRRYAGGMDDPARMASAFAGIAVGNIQDNSIIIRGNSPRGVLWRLEGVEIPNPSHFAGANVAGGGFTTLFSNHLLSNSDFFTGAFPAEYGNALAGVFDIKLRNGNNEKREYAFQAGVMGIDLAAEGPFINGKKASFLINYRYSTFGLIKSFIPSEQVPEYQDLSFKLNFPLKNRGTISFWGIGGNDKNAEPVTDDSTKWIYSWDRVQYDLTTNVGAVGLNYKKIISESAYIHSSIVASSNNFTWDMKRMNDNLVLLDTVYVDNTESKYTFSTFINKKFSKKHTNRTGLVLNMLSFNTQIDGAFGSNEMIELANSSEESFLVQAYTQSKYNLSPKILFNIGVHTQYYILNENYTIEPRAGINYQINSDHKLSFAYGNHSQTELLKVYLYKYEENGEEYYPNKNLKFSRAHHFIVAYDYFINRNLRIKIEPYYQYLYNIPVEENGTWSMLNYEQEYSFNRILTNNGTGTNIGIDFTFERFLKNDYYWLTTASIFDSKYKTGNGQEYNSRFNKNFVFTALGGKEFVWKTKKGSTNILGLNSRISVTGGHRIVPVDEQLSLQNNEIFYDWSNPYLNQNPTDLFIDVTLSYRVNKKNHSSIWALQVKNITGSPSNYLYQYNLQTKEVEFTHQTIAVPSVSYKIEF